MSELTQIVDDITAKYPVTKLEVMNLILYQEQKSSDRNIIKTGQMDMTTTDYPRAGTIIDRYLRGKYGKD